MVIVRKLERDQNQDAPEIDYQYNLIQICFQEPDTDPSEYSDARPYEFDENGRATKYATSCAYCGAGCFLTIEEDLLLKDDTYFGRCYECGAGVPPETPEFEDPFQNPIKDGKLATADLDTSMITRKSSVAGETVLSKLPEGITETLESEATVKPADDYQKPEEETEETEEISNEDFDHHESSFDNTAEDFINNLDEYSVDDLKNMLDQEDDEV